MGLLDSKIFKVLTGAITGNYSSVIETLLKGVGIKSKDKINSVIKAGGTVEEILDLISGEAKDLLKNDPEFQKSVIENDTERMKIFYDAMIEYEGRAADQHWFIMIYRGMVRPTITYADWILLAYLCLKGIAGNLPVEAWIPQPIAYLSYMVNIFWFGDRLLQKGVSQFFTTKNGG